MWNRILANKGKIIAGILALGLALAGINMSQDEQTKIVDTASHLLPDAPAATTP